jgi:hypothetical protein
LLFPVSAARQRQYRHRPGAAVQPARPPDAAWPTSHTVVSPLILRAPDPPLCAVVSLHSGGTRRCITVILSASSCGRSRAFSFRILSVSGGIRSGIWQVLSGPRG